MAVPVVLSEAHGEAVNNAKPQIFAQAGGDEQALLLKTIALLLK